MTPGRGASGDNIFYCIIASAVGVKPLVGALYCRLYCR